MAGYGCKDIIAIIYRGLADLMLTELNNHAPKIEGCFAISVQKIEGSDFHYAMINDIGLVEAFLEDSADWYCIDDEYAFGPSYGDFQVVVHDVFDLIERVPPEMAQEIPRWEVLVDIYRRDKALRDDEVFGGSYHRSKATVAWLNDLKEKNRLEGELLAINKRISISDFLITSWKELDQLKETPLNC